MRINKGIVAWAVTAMVAVVPAQMAFAGGDDHKQPPKHHKHDDHKHHKHHGGFHGGSDNHNDFSRDNNGRCQSHEEGGLFGHLLDDVNVIAVDAEVCNGDDVVQVGEDNETN